MARDLVDPATPLADRTITKDGEDLMLVFSDEFNEDVSNYTDKVKWNSSDAEPDVKWTASNTLSYDAFGDSFMHPGMLETRDGALHVTAAKVKFESADYVGGQLTSWNRVCFQGGYLEVRFKPATNINGDPLDGFGMDGLWPALWTMGNLLRDNYMIRNRHIWPYSYSDCQCPGGFFWGVGRGQEISGCSARGDYGLNIWQGRGAVEFDLLETTKCKHFDTAISMSIFGADPSDSSKSTIYSDTCLLQTVQIGPRRPWEYRPFPFSPPTERTPWYDATGRRDSIWDYGRPDSATPDLELFDSTFSNIAFYGFGWYDSISATTHFDRQSFLEWHTVGLQVVIDHSCAMYQFPNVPLNSSMAARCREHSRMSLYHDGNVTQRLHGVALRAVGVTPAREVPQEPLYILLEHKISPSFGFGTPDEALLPAVMKVDYVRLYQRTGEEPRLSCSPPDHPTAEYIRNHRIEYGVQLEDAVATVPNGVAVLALVLSLILMLLGSTGRRAEDRTAHSERRPRVLRNIPGPRTLALGAEGVAIGATFLGEFMVAVGSVDVMGTLLIVYLPLSLGLATIASTVFTNTVSVLATAVAVGAIGTYTAAPDARTVTFWVSFASTAVLVLVAALCLLPRCLTEALGTASFGSVIFATSLAQLGGCNAYEVTAVWWGGTALSCAGDASGDTWGVAMLIINLVAFAIGLAAQTTLHHFSSRFTFAHLIRRPRAAEAAPPSSAAEPEEPHTPLNQLRDTLRRIVTPNQIEVENHTPSSRRSNSARNSDGDDILTPSRIIKLDTVIRLAVVDKELKEFAHAAAASGRRTEKGGRRISDNPADLVPCIGHVVEWVGSTELRTIERFATVLSRTYGFQPSAIAVQAGNLHALLRQLRSRPAHASEQAAALSLHAALLENYRVWCKVQAEEVRTIGVVGDCMLYLAIWGEAANLRHIPECLCFLFHEALGQHAAFTSGDTTAPRVVIDDFLLRVTRPLYEAAARRMKDDKLTYDDVNELFWRRKVLKLHPFDDDAGMTRLLAALAAASKTHMETPSWMHLHACFGDIFFFAFLAVYLLCVLAYCVINGAWSFLYVTRLSSALGFIGVYELQRELGALYVSARLDAHETFSLLTAWRLLLYVVYVIVTMSIVFAAFTEEACTLDAMGAGRSTLRGEPGACVCPTAEPWPSYQPCVYLPWWITFWVLVSVQLGMQLLYYAARRYYLDRISREMHVKMAVSEAEAAETADGEAKSTRASLAESSIASLGAGVDQPASTLYRKHLHGLDYLASRYYGSVPTRAPLAYFFWVPLVLVWGVFIYYNVAKPGMTAFVTWRAAFQQGYMLLSELTIMILIWAFMIGAIAFILIDICFQLAVMVGAVLHLPLGKVPLACAATSKNVVAARPEEEQLRIACAAYMRKCVATEGASRASSDVVEAVASLGATSSTRANATKLTSIEVVPLASPAAEDRQGAASSPPAVPSDAPAPLPSEIKGEEVTVVEVTAETDGATADEVQWRVFGGAWDAIIAELRAADLISNRERELLSFSSAADFVLAPMKTPAELGAALASGRPANGEAQRRLKGFLSSLNCEMPAPVPVACMRSVTVLTPMYSETIIFSYAELTARGSDERPLLVVLAELMHDEWQNFCERVGGVAALLAREPSRAAELAQPESPHGEELRWWASMRGQTLSRTVRGMMVYREALLHQARLEGHGEAAAVELVDAKFEMVIGCQKYGDWKAAGHYQQADVELLLRRYPGLRAAFPEKVHVAAPPAAQEVDNTFLGTMELTESALVCANGDGRIVELGRVRLPGNPILGEGKPENQNIAIPFTRGQHLMIVDMNQDGYFEEALKLRNLLEEFPEIRPLTPSSPSEHEPHQNRRRPVTLVGYPEHIFSQSAGFATSIYAAMQERYFGTFFQRVLASPLDIRMHYGHPDLADKLHFMTRGGISQASKSINLSEDVFAGYKTTLRGGRSIFKEYHSCGKGRGANFAEINGFFAKLSQGAAYQLQSRDVYRCSRLLPIERRASMFFSAFGFYVINAAVMYVVHITAYVYAILAVTNLMTTFSGMTISLMVQSTLFPLYAAILLTFPDVLLCCVEEGVRGGFKFFVGKVITLGPLYYVFIAQTRAYHFTNTLRWGKAAYFATKRTMSVAHQDFHELFQAYARSHLAQGVESFMMLMVAKHINAPSDFGLRVWMYMAICAALVGAPFLYNPLALVPSYLYRDMRMWHKWVSRAGLDGQGDRGDRGQTWAVWWEKVTPAPEEFGMMAMLGAILMSVAYTFLAFNLLPNISRTIGLGSAAPSVGHYLWPLSLGLVCVVLPPFVCALFDTHVDTVAKPEMQRTRTFLSIGLAVVAIVWYCSVAVAAGEYVLGPTCPYHQGGAWFRLYHSIPVVFWNAMFIYMVLAACAYALSVLQVYRLVGARYVLRLLQRTRDYLLYAVLMAILCCLSALVLPHFMQTRILFQTSPLFFERRWPGDLKAMGWCILVFPIGLIGLLLYLMLFVMLGMSPVMSLDPFQCS